MRIALIVLVFFAMPAWAQAPAAKPAPNARPAPTTKAAAAPAETCAECGVIQSVRAITKTEPPPPTDSAKPSGLVATVPLGGGKPKVGSSTRLGRDASTRNTEWEVIVRYDDGRFTALRLDEPGDWRDGDKVRVDRGQLYRRNGGEKKAGPEASGPAK